MNVTDRTKQLTGGEKESGSTDFLQKTWVVCALALVCTFLWGSASPCIKLGYALFQIPSSETWTQVLFAGTRFVLAGVLTILIGSVLNRKMLVPTKSSIPSIAKLGLFQTILQYIFFYIGLAHNSGVKASIINGSNTFFVILLAGLVFHQEKLTGPKILGCIIGFAGVVLVNLGGAGLDMSFHWNGEFFILISTVSAACSSAFIKKFSTKANPVLLSGWQFMMGGTVLIIMGKLMGGKFQFEGIAPMFLLLYMACISAVAYTLWSLLLKYNPPSRIAVFGFMNPVFGVMLSALLLKEKGQAFSLTGLTSLILVCIGIYIVNRENPLKEASTDKISV